MSVEAFGPVGGDLQNALILHQRASVVSSQKQGVGQLLACLVRGGESLAQAGCASALVRLESLLGAFYPALQWTAWLLRACTVLGGPSGAPVEHALVRNPLLARRFEFLQRLREILRRLGIPAVRVIEPAHRVGHLERLLAFFEIRGRVQLTQPVSG